MSKTDLRLENVLRAARRTAFYGSELATVATAPPLYLQQFFGHRKSLRDPEGRVEPAVFRYPVQPAPEVTVLAGGFQPTARVRVLSDMNNVELASLQQGALAGPVGVLRELAGRQTPLQFPVVVFTGPRFGALTAEDHDLFWNAFEVPVFEYLLGLDNQPLACECEAHDALHVDTEAAWFENVAGELLVTPLRPGEYPVLRLATGLAGEIRDGLCDCGAAGPRLVNVRPALRRMAARA